MIRTTLRLPFNLNRLLKELIFRISPKMLLVVMALVIFLVETFIMFVLREVPPLPRTLEALLDSTVLLCLLTPFYQYIYKPFWDERQKQMLQIRFLSQQLLNATEEESKRIAHAIHDQCGQTLTALQFGLQTLKKLISAENQEARLRTNHLEQVASQLSDEFRDLTSRLRPAILDEAGLIPALSWQVKEFRRNYPGINLTEHLLPKAEFPHPLDSMAEEAIFRICQEALTNIVRHARATEVQITLQFENSKLELKIEDNGAGFDLDSCLEQKNRACGVGLLGMRERALMVGGYFRIISRPGLGTAILASFPVH